MRSSNFERNGLLKIEDGDVVHVEVRRLDACHSSQGSAMIAPTSRNTAWSLGKTPTMLLRHLIYL